MQNRGSRDKDKDKNSRITLPIIIVQGAQWGSEAKGSVAAWMCMKRNVDWAVRTGAVNAGHTVLWPPHPTKDGCHVAVKMQQLPTGWVNPKTQLVLGAGAFISPEILAAEIRLVSNLTGEDIRKRLFIDHRASLHLPAHQDQAKLENRHLLIGATGKGCSVAITDKIRYRGRGYRLFKEWLESSANPYIPADYANRTDMLAGLNFCDTQELLHDVYDNGQQILLEGTQGSLLDLHLGPYPYTTHKQCTAAEWVTECGLAPGMQYETILVARTYPIRVAGNSGPMEYETTWPNLAREINRKLMLCRMGQRVKTHAITDFEAALYEIAQSGKYILPKDELGDPNYDMHKWTTVERVRYADALSNMNADALGRMSGPILAELMNLFELTTVTKKLRRVANFDPNAVRDQVKYNRASSVILTFFNYQFPETWGKTEEEFNWLPQYKGNIRALESAIDCRVSAISTGPGVEHFIECL